MSNPTYRKKLIEVTLPLVSINDASAKEKGNPFLKGHPPQSAIPNPPPLLLPFAFSLKRSAPFFALCPMRFALRPLSSFPQQF